MSDSSYNLIRTIGRPIIFVAMRKLVLHEERAQIPGGCLLAANHFNYFDPIVLTGTTTRLIDWIATSSLFAKSWQNRFMRAINCIPIDRGRTNFPEARGVVKKLRSGRMVGIFPEGGMREHCDSMLHGGDFSPRFAHLAEMGRVPVLPVVILGSAQLMNPSAWLPGARTFIAINYGKPIAFRHDLTSPDAREALKCEFKQALLDLYTELRAHAVLIKHARSPWWHKHFSEIP
jgi:1-acyl-sn-glycerol-3-phosphate acyltransferase